MAGDPIRDAKRQTLQDLRDTLGPSIEILEIGTLGNPSSGIIVSGRVRVGSTKLIFFYSYRADGTLEHFSISSTSR